MKTVLQALKDEVHYRTEMKYAPSTFLKANRSKVLWPTVS